MKRREWNKRVPAGQRLKLLAQYVALFVVAGWGAAHAQGLVERPIAITPNIDCPNGCKWSLSIVNPTGQDFAVEELAIVIEPPLSDNLVDTLPRRLKDGTLDPAGTLLVCSATLETQIREPIKVPMGQSSAVQVEVPYGHLVHSRILGEISKLKEMPLLCWNAVDAESGVELGSGCSDLRSARNVLPLAEDSLIPGDLCDNYPGDCVCPDD